MNRTPWSHLLSVERIHDLHGEGIRRHGGLSSVPVDGCVERSVGAAWSAECYTTDDAATPGLLFAGYLLFYLAKNHCWSDGTKRVAWLAMSHVFAELGLEPDVSDDDAEAFVLDLITRADSQASDVVEWLFGRLVAIEPSER